MTERQPPDRRRFLKAAGSVAAAAALAGCDHDGGDADVDEQLAADPAGLSAQGIQDLGYPGIAAKTVDRGTLSRSTGGGEWSYTLTDSHYTYGLGRQLTYPAFVRATPRAVADGEELNRLVDADLKQLVRDGPFGVGLLERHGYLAGGTDHEWGTQPADVESHSLSMLGQQVSAVRFEGTATPKGGSGTDRVTVGLARVNDGTGTVVAGIATVGPLQGREDRFTYVLENVVTSVERSPPTSIGSPVDTGFSDERLVQTVADTTVENLPSPHHVPDPDLALDDYVAPLFGVGGSTHPERTYVEADATGHRDSFVLARSDLSTGSLGELADAFDRYRRGAAVGEQPDPFRLEKRTGDVTLRAEAPSGFETDRTTIAKGTDYETTDLPPMRIGFITCFGQGLYGGNAYGSASTYHDSVANGIQYLRRVFPGDLYAYRYDVPFGGSVDTGPDWMAFARDAFWARVLLDGHASDVSLPPSDGQLWAFGGSRSDAERAINRNGFNAWVLVVPDGYFTYHDITGPNGNPPGGLTPSPVNSPISNVGYNFFAAAVSEQGGNSDKSVGQTVAHELGHFFGGGRLYELDTADEPLAQRDDDDSNETIDGEPVDYAHARYLNSDEDSDGNVDGPGITSLGFDFSGGTYRHVEEYNVNPGSMDIKPSDNSPDDRMESLMSYDGGDLWTDAHLHQAIIRNDWTEKTLAEFTFSAVGGTTEGEGLRFDAVTVGPGMPTDDDAEEGTVRVEMRAPDEERLVSRLVPRTYGLSDVGQEVTPVAFDVPFPQQAAAVDVEVEGEAARLNPIVRPVRDAVDRVPDRGFVDDGMRAELEQRLDEIGSRTRDRAYAEADDQLTRFDESIAETVRVEYERYAKQPNRPALLALTAHMHERLAVLAEY